MKKLLSLFVMALLTLAVMPAVLADGDGTNGGIIIDVDTENTAPEIYTDDTQRSWYPNDQTYYTAEQFSDAETNAYCDVFYDVGLRGDYVFGGETVSYYVIAEDVDGADDIDSVIIRKDGYQAGTCMPIDTPNAKNCLSDAGWSRGWNAYVSAKYGVTWDEETMELYRCKINVPKSWTGTSEIDFQVSDVAGETATTAWSEFLKFNPALSVTLTGAINFGSTTPGTTVPSNTVSLNNVGSDGVAMDMYIASEDYFTDPSGTGYCGADGNGIPFTAFTYYASKGSVDSGSNDNVFPGLGETGAWGDELECVARPDEFTPIPSHSGHIEDMCRVINHLQDSSVLTQGQSMNIRFKLDVPTPCQGSFTEGQFHFEGRVI